MFTHIRRHQKWLWIVISAAVIISFVWYFNPNQRMGGQRGDGSASSTVGTIYGEPITLGQYHDAQREAILQYLFTYNQWPDNDEFSRQMRPIERETKNRLLLIRKLDEYNIEVDRTAVTDWVRNAFADPQTKQFNPNFVDRFLQQIQQKGLKEADFERYVRHQVGIQHLAAVAGASGKLVTPQEVEHTLRQEREKMDTKVVVFSSSNYVSKVAVTPQAIAEYYTNSSARYRLPERIQLSYVPFPASNYLSQAEAKLASQTNLNQQLDALYEQRGPQFYTDAQGQPLTRDAAKARIREEALKEGALGEARRAAYDFAREFEKVKINPANPNPAEPLENLAASKGLNVQVTEPFSQMTGPHNLNLPDAFTRIAFQLTPQEPIVPEPVTGEDGVYVLAFKRRIASELQPLDSIRDQVTKDFTSREGFRLMREAATEFLSKATNVVASGGQLEPIAQQSGLQVVDLGPVLREGREAITNLPPVVDSGALRSAAADLKPGQLSSFVPTGNGGFIVLLEKTVPPGEEEIKEELPNFLVEYRRRNSVQAFNDWFSKEMQLARVTIAGEKDDAMTQ